ncbi:hypothetical protein E4T44_00808 [Aureobasidium sp. EXF-8845]|nr:hypothetical protein E4T44_00808 [Aureobasidium sp. EXF-8845]KAI4857772.1 hypothetical protein E4T45_00726 [Aureobasidium sp. EXF-8846]
MDATAFGVPTRSGDGIVQVLSRTFSAGARSHTSRRTSRFYDDQDEVLEKDPHPIRMADDWKLMPEVKMFHQQNKADNLKDRHLGVTWKNLVVEGIGSGNAYKENILSQFNVRQVVNEIRHKAPLRTIIDNSHGCVKPKEMLLILGRPGSGCTTLLKMLANMRDGYADVQGDVKFGDMSHEAAKEFRGQIIMNTEEELFFPTLTVGQTIDFATRLKVPHNLPSNMENSKDFQVDTRDFLLKSMGISHTKDTKVGDAFVRGVSGGERKRVSIIEALASRGTVYCWDNSTRGLDASTALDWARALRAMTDVLGLSTIVTLYQAGNGIFKLFDKVLVLDEGKQLYYGPMAEARPYFEDLGFVCSDAANTGDFLTGVTSPHERCIRPGFENKFPRTAQEIAEIYAKSALRARMEQEYDYPSTEIAKHKTQEFKEAVHYDKSKGLIRSSPLTTSFYTQVRACIIRQYQVIWGDKATFIIKQASTVIQALIAGSLFYNAPDNSSGLFLKGGSLFFALLYNCLLAMSEVTDSFTGRPVLAKHKSFAFFHPAAFCIAQIAADIPVIIFQVSHFSIVLYFMTSLRQSADAFFTYWIVIIATTMCITAMFRSIGAAFGSFDGASKVSGLLFTAFVLFAGYQIPFPHMHGWSKWIFWINPLSYAFEALMSNELHAQLIECVGQNLVPHGPGYDRLDNQACAGIAGAPMGATSFVGDDYLTALHYSHAHVWRNFGIVWAWWIFYVAITVWFTMHWTGNTSKSSSLVPRENDKHEASHASDSEAGQIEKSTRPDGGSSADSITIQNQLVRNTSVFTWKDLVYTVKTPSGDRILLDHVHGYVKPGMLGALMGSSGAGKTTLLDVLAQRKTDGTIHGSILVDGRPLSVSFQRSAGYCEQLDVHESMATVREALEFSALLRQPRTTPREEKLAYVDTIIDLLEMQDIEHTLIGGIGAGLSVEQRKRLTIGVELVSKPSILIFLDEPTSGLDGQAAFNTIRFLRKLADAGQAILVTIHQPSASLFEQFDTLLLLARGGKTVYFGDIGTKSATLMDYFSRNGAPCPPAINPAEHMIDVVSGTLVTNRDWNQVWLESEEYQRTVQELDEIISTAAAAPPGTVDDGHEFATSSWEQIKLVTHRMNVSLFRNTDYVNNKLMLHITLGLFTGFAFFNVSDGVGDLQLDLFAVFNFIFVAPGVINQLQPLFIERRDIFETREKKSKMYSWYAFTTGLIVSEVPYLCLCAVLYFACWYYTVGFPTDSNKSGATFWVMLMYEFIYTGLGQAIAAYAPNAVFASLVNPLILGTLVSFCGVLVPYDQIQVFWRYWIYYLNPFTYLMDSIMVFTMFDKKINCTDNELAIFDPPSGQTCASYLADYMMPRNEGSRINLLNPDAMSECQVCQYRVGSDYLAALEINDYYFGWRDSAIVLIFVLSGYAMVYLLMKLRTKASKKAQ